MEDEREELRTEVAELKDSLIRARLLDTPTTSPDVTSTEEVVVNLANVRSYEDGELEDEDTTRALHQKAESMKSELEELRKLNAKLNREVTEKQAQVESSKKVIEAMSGDMVGGCPWGRQREGRGQQTEVDHGARPPS